MHCCIGIACSGYVWYDHMIKGPTSRTRQNEGPKGTERGGAAILCGVAFDGDVASLRSQFFRR